MQLRPGAKLGSYEIEEFVGAGGMGEVYRARDPRLGRTVAIKVLPAHLAHNSEFRQRFEREAKVVSSLSHPNICHLYDIGEAEGIDFLVMEFLHGETLADRLARGPLPMPEVLSIAIETAEALAKAHRLSIVHRDLKPANLMLTREGSKLLDFGLARDINTAVAVAAAAGPSTTALPITERGTIIGTFQYMSPEQLHGREADARSDVFTFGALLYEMATGRAAFQGDSQASLIAAVLERQPPPPHQVRSEVPLSLQAVIRRCLEKEPERRWQCAADIASDLRRIAAMPERRTPEVARRQPSVKLAWGLALLLLATVLAVGVHMARAHPAVLVVRSAVLAPDSAHFAFIGDIGGPLVLSPDARYLAFVGSGATGVNQLFVRPLGMTVARAIAGTEHAAFPFWSPDGRAIAFFADGKLKRVDVAGGAPVAVCKVGDARGGAWGRGGALLLAADWRGEIFQVPETGGTPSPVTHLAESHTTHRWPFFLPDGKHFLYVAANHQQQSEGAAIYFASLDGKENKLLLNTKGNAVYADGYLVFVNGTELLARPLDPASGEFLGEAVTLADDVLYDPGIWRGIFTASQTGVLAYQPGGIASNQSQLAWFDRAGKRLEEVGDRRSQLSVQVSRSGRWAVLDDSSAGPAPDVWITDMTTGHRRRITVTPAGSAGVADPIWSPDEKWVAYVKVGTKEGGIYRKRVDGLGSEELLWRTPAPSSVDSWTPDGNALVLVQDSGAGRTGRDLWLLPLTGERKPQPLLQTRTDESEPHVSPDGRWITYTSNETGRQEIYLATFPGLGRKWKISSDGGFSARWRGDSKELFYLSPDFTIQAVEVRTNNDAFEPGPTTPLFRAELRAILAGAAYDVAPDGKRFLLNAPAQETAKPVTLIQNWPLEVAQRAH